MEDEKIISLFIKRVESAITETSKKYGGLCLKIANNILYDKCDAEECVNDTYLKVWNTIPPTIPNIFSAYVAKITRNLSINLYKKNNAQKRGNGEIELVLDELSECISDNSSVDEIFDRKEITKAISVFLDSIDDEKNKYLYKDIGMENL